MAILFLARNRGSYWPHQGSNKGASFNNLSKLTSLNLACSNSELFRGLKRGWRRRMTSSIVTHLRMGTSQKNRMFKVPRRDIDELTQTRARLKFKALRAQRTPISVTFWTLQSRTLSSKRSLMDQGLSTSSLRLSKPKMKKEPISSCIGCPNINLSLSYSRYFWCFSRPHILLVGDQTSML